MHVKPNLMIWEEVFRRFTFSFHFLRCLIFRLFDFRLQFLFPVLKDRIAENQTLQSKISLTDCDLRGSITHLYRVLSTENITKDKLLNSSLIDHASIYPDIGKHLDYLVPIFKFYKNFNILIPRLDSVSRNTMLQNWQCRNRHLACWSAPNRSIT